MSKSEFKICLVVPVYNESNRINILVYEKFVENNDSVKIIFVNDASTDNTLQILTTLKNNYPLQVEVLTNTTNMGKGEAIRKGMIHALLKSNSPHLGFIDADLSVPLHDLIRFSKALEASKACAALGVRDLSDTYHVKRTFSRKYLSYLFRYYVQIVFQFNITDTQCGAKIFKREIVEILYRNPFETRWLSDVELLLRLKKYSIANQLSFSDQLIPLAVTYYEDKTGSKFIFFEFLRTTIDLIKLSLRYRFFRV